MKLDKRGGSSYEKLFRIHFVAIVLCDLLLLAIFISKTDLCRLAPAVWFYFHPCSRTTAISLGQPTQKHFSEIYPQINKRSRFYYLGCSLAIFYYLSFSLH